MKVVITMKSEMLIITIVFFRYVTKHEKNVELCLYALIAKNSVYLWHFLNTTIYVIWYILCQTFILVLIVHY